MLVLLTCGFNSAPGEARVGLNSSVAVKWNLTLTSAEVKTSEIVMVPAEPAVNSTGAEVQLVSKVVAVPDGQMNDAPLVPLELVLDVKTCKYSETASKFCTLAVNV